MNTLPKITFEASDSITKQFDFTYECIKDGKLVETDGTMQPYHTGKDIEYNIEMNSIYVDCIITSIDEEIYVEIENEIHEEFNNKVKF